MEITIKINLDLWCIRDENNRFFIFKHKPRKYIKLGFWGAYDDCYCVFGREYIDLATYQLIIPNIEDYFDFSQVQWEDSEPKQLKDIVRK